MNLNKCDFCFKIKDEYMNNDFQNELDTNITDVCDDCCMNHIIRCDKTDCNNLNVSEKYDRVFCSDCMSLVEHNMSVTWQGLSNNEKIINLMAWLNNVPYF